MHNKMIKYHLRVLTPGRAYGAPFYTEIVEANSVRIKCNVIKFLSFDNELIAVYPQNNTIIIKTEE